MKKKIELSLQKAREIYGKSKEMDELLLANFTKEELEKSKLPKRWEDLESSIHGYYIENDSEIIEMFNCSATEANKNLFKTFKQAKSALAKAQLSQLMAVYNDGWEADWEDSSTKYTIIRCKNEIEEHQNVYIYNFLNLKSKELRDEFLKNFKGLIETYFEL